MDFSRQAKDAFENDIAVKIMNKGGVSFAGIGKALEKGIGDLLKQEEEPQDVKLKAKDRANENEQFEIDLEHVETEHEHSIKKEGKIKISFEIIPGKLYINKIFISFFYVFFCTVLQYRISLSFFSNLI